MMMNTGEPVALDVHISSQEPRMFPGVVHERVRRRSLRMSTGGSDGGGGILAVGLAKSAVREGENGEEADESE